MSIEVFDLIDQGGDRAWWESVGFSGFGGDRSVHDKTKRIALHLIYAPRCLAEDLSIEWGRHNSIVKMSISQRIRGHGEGDYRTLHVHTSLCSLQVRDCRGL